MAMQQVFSEKLRDPKESKKFPARYGTQYSLQLSPKLPNFKHINSVHALASHILKIHFNIILQEVCFPQVYPPGYSPHIKAQADRVTKKTKKDLMAFTTLCGEVKVNSMCKS
jgi:hypothetical protein